MKLPRMPAAVVFDMDGLLFDTETLRQEALLLAAADGGHEIVLDVFNRAIGLPWTQSRPLFVSHFGETFPAEEFHKSWVDHFWVIAETRLTLKPGALELLDLLERTIALTTPINPCGDESARCSGSSQPDLPSVSSASMPLSTTRSIFNATSFPDRR